MKTNGFQLTARNILIILVTLLVVALAALGYLWYQFANLEKAHVLLGQEKGKVEALLTNTQNNLADAQNENIRLAEALEAEQDRLRELGQQVEEITGTVGDLEKLAKLDPELLEKYSKVFFLSDNYVPSKLSDIPEKYLYDESTPQKIHREVLPFLADMIRAADRDDVKLYVRSGYRSFGTQAGLKSGYTVTYGTGANQFSADQGYSEHQLGTTVDFTTTGINGGLEGFGTTPAYKWLLENAYRYGFVLSYPEGNSYYIFEPWHWRFVGTDLARDLDRKDLNFYDLDQRELDTYLLEIFD